MLNGLHLMLKGLYRLIMANTIYYGSPSTYCVEHPLLGSPSTYYIECLLLRLTLNSIHLLLRLTLNSIYVLLQFTVVCVDHVLCHLLYYDLYLQLPHYMSFLCELHLQLLYYAIHATAFFIWCVPFIFYLYSH